MKQWKDNPVPLRRAATSATLSMETPLNVDQPRDRRKKHGQSKARPRLVELREQRHEGAAADAPAQASSVVVFRSDRDEAGMVLRTKDLPLEEVLRLATKKLSRTSYLCVRKLFAANMQQVLSAGDLLDGMHLLATDGKRPEMKNLTFWKSIAKVEA